jgi:hypothetical protein
MRVNRRCHAGFEGGEGYVEHHGRVAP